MSEDESEDVVRRFLDAVWNAHDLSRVEEFVSRVMRYHGPRGPAKDFVGYRAMMEGFLRGVPDLRFDVEEAIAAGDLVALRLRIRGTHAGEWRGLPPTGRTIDVQGRPWFRVQHGKVVEVWSLFDELGAMQQLGAVPETLGTH